MTLTVIVDIDNQGDHCSHEAHVAEGVGAAGHSVAAQVFTFLLFLLVLIHSLASNVSSPEIYQVRVFTLGNEILPFRSAKQASLSVQGERDIFFSQQFQFFLQIL